MKPIRIFRTGRQTDAHGTTLEFSAKDLQSAAQVYGPAKHRAPLVIGHPATDDPAYGWVQSLGFNEPFLNAIPEQVNTEFADIVNQGAYQYVSAAFYPRNHPHNPVPDSYYLRHLGFLGQPFQGKHAAGG